MHNIWLKDSQMMTQDDYKKELIKVAQLIETHQASRQLINTLNFQYTIDIDLQQWTNEYIIKRTREAGIKKVAFIIAEEIFSQMSIEQAMEGEEGKTLDTRYFTSKEEAREWLVKD